MTINKTDKKKGDVAMDEITGANQKKKGLFALLKESMTKTSEGCGPGCGCHAVDEKEKAKGSEFSKDSKNR